ncbi:MAG TPA: cytosolic protein [Bacillales bacterium]|nr:cytosolic protein [Bacillales bacterium]
MSVKSKMSQLFSGHIETAEHHEDSTLQTHYYKTTKDRLMKELTRIFNEKNHFEIVAESAERGEITVNVRGRKLYYLVASVIMVRPFRTAVDFTVTAKRGMDFGFGRKVIDSLYRSIGQSFEYIGTGENK